MLGEIAVSMYKSPSVKQPMQKLSLNALRGFLALSLCLVFGLARAQENQPVEADPPDRAARLSYLQGEVSLQPAGEQEWANAIVNRPLTTGDKLWTEQGARAEIQVGEAAVRLGSNTGFSFLNVDDNTIQMRMTAGVLNVRVRALDGNDQIEVDTPNLALSLLRPGNYRVEVNDAGDTTVVKISEGEAEASAGSQSTVVHAQQVATFRGSEQFGQLAMLGSPDEFDSWSLERDRRDDHAASSQTAQYVAPEVTGYQDLDANGTWSQEPEYGNVWTPTHVAMGWSPYQYGRWVWVAPWGWTWVDDSPWGYAPFHYGRWAHVHERWCWVPGPRHVRAVYAPALVGWVGSPGMSVSLSIGGGGVAWFPLGPREVYVPARRYSPRYVERVNVTNTVIVNRTYITNVYNNRVTNVTYRNRAVPGAVTAVSRTTFTSAERIGEHRVRFDERQFDRVGTTAMAPQIQPGHESRLGGASRVNFRAPPQTVVNRRVIVKREPPPAAAPLTRNNGGHVDTPHIDRPIAPSERTPRTQDFGRGAQVNPNEPVVHLRPDRPSHADRPTPETAPRAQPTVPDQHAYAEQPRDDRPSRQQQEREAQARAQQQHEADYRQRQQYEQQRESHDQQRQQQERQQQEHQQQERRQADVQQQQQQQERASQQQQQQQHAAQQVQQQSQQQSQQQQQQQHQRNDDHPHAEVHRPAEDKPKPQKDFDQAKQQ